MRSALCKGTVIESSDFHRLTVEDLAERRRQVATLVKKHRETEWERKRKTKEEAKAAAKPATEAPKTVTPAVQQRQQQAQVDALGKQQERGAGHPPAGGPGKGILAPAASTPGKKGKGEQARQKAEQDNQDIQSARAGRASPAHPTSGNGGNSTPGGSPEKRKQTRQIGLRAKRPKPDAVASDLQPRATDAEVIGETEMESLFGPAQDTF